MDVVIRNDLCEHEINFIKKRQRKIQEALQRHGIPYAENNFPRVALLGSGGGQRAQTGFLGVMRQLGNEDLLDLFLYVAGVSGSTWCMSSLYEDPEWSRHADDAASDVLLSMSEGKDASLLECVEWLKDRQEDGDLSLSDVWGVIISRFKGVSMETRPLVSDTDEDGTNPYPLYSAIERDCLNKNKSEGKARQDLDPYTLWFEFGPHESGFVEPGVYVETSLLKKEFEGGKVKPDQRERIPFDMVQLQGICGCAMGDLDTVKEYIKDSVLDWIHSVIPDWMRETFLMAPLPSGPMGAEDPQSPVDEYRSGTGGCALGRFDTIKKYIKDYIWGWIYAVIPDWIRRKFLTPLASGVMRAAGPQGHVGEYRSAFVPGPMGSALLMGESTLMEPIQSIKDDFYIIFILADLMKNYAERKYSELHRLTSLLGGQHGEFSPTLQRVDDETWSKMTDQEKKNIVESICDELMASIEKWSADMDAPAFESEPMGAAGSMEEALVAPMLCMGQKQDSIFMDALRVFKCILRHLKDWPFGTMANILYNFPDSKVPEEMCKNDTMHLIDAGIFLNSPYPSALREGRDVDVIISFDFSEIKSHHNGPNPFETVEIARDYADANKRPFPEINVKDEEKVRPKSFYVFKGKPTVIHIPLFNMDNCKNESAIEKEWNEYGTFQKTYRDKEKINHLADLAAENVRMNKDRILDEIRKAAEQRMAKR